MQFVVNILGSLTVGLCAVLLLIAYSRVKQRLLLWSGGCFLCLAPEPDLPQLDSVRL